MSREILLTVDVLAREKNVPRETVFGALELALAAATKKLMFPGEEADVRVAVDRETGAYEAFRRWLVVPDEAGLQEPDREIILSDARDDDPEIAVEGVEGVEDDGRGAGAREGRSDFIADVAAFPDPDDDDFSAVIDGIPKDFHRFNQFVAQAG